MFEKEAEEYLKKDGTKAEQILNMLNEISPLKMTLKQLPFILAMIQQTFQDGAEFGYNKAKVEVEESYRESLCNSELNLASVTEQLEELEKANEWHYVKDGDLPEEDKSVMIYAKLVDGVVIGKRRKQGRVYEWYSATYDGTFCLRDCLRDTDVIAWKEIVPPKEKEK